MQFQADLIGTPVEVASDADATALGAAALAGLGTGLWESVSEVARLVRRGEVYEPRLDRAQAEMHRVAWRRALARALG
jgi:glycerol kinase